MGGEGEVERSKFESSVTSLLLAEGPRVQPRKNSNHSILLGLGFYSCLSSLSLMYFFSSSSRGPFGPFGIDLGLHQRYCD
jgi:hypothetical protein